MSHPMYHIGAVRLNIATGPRISVVAPTLVSRYELLCNHFKIYVLVAPLGSSVTHRICTSKQARS
jgi:hypothetical protein